MSHEHDRKLEDTPFNKHSFNDGSHNSPLDQGRIDVGTDNIKVNLIQGINEDQFRSVLGKSLMATTGIDPDAPLEDVPWEEMLKGGLQASLESQVVVFEISGISRTCTHQLVRTRKAAFHQQSQRATFMGRKPNVRMPQSIYENVDARVAFQEAVYYSRRAYDTLCDLDISYQDAREVLNEGTETYILCEYDLRTFIDTYRYRACVMFNHQIVYCFRTMGRLLVEAHPWLEPYIKISCEKTKMCTFAGWESVEGFCEFPWATEDNRTYRAPSSLRIGKKE